MNAHSLKTTRPVTGLVDHRGMASTIQKGERHALDIHVDCGCGSNVHDARYVCGVVQGIEYRLDGCGGYGTDVRGKFGDASVSSKMTRRFLLYLKELVSWQ